MILYLIPVDMRTCWEPVYSFLCHLWPYSLSPATVRGGRGVKCSSATRIQRVIGCDTCWSGRYYPGCSLFWSVRLRSVWPCWRAACYTGDWVQCRWHTRRRVWCESLSGDNQTAAGSADAVLHLNFSVGRGRVTFLIFGCSRDETRVVFTMALVRKQNGHLLKKSSHLCHIKETCFHHDGNIWSWWEASVLMRTFWYVEGSPGEQGNVQKWKTLKRFSNDQSNRPIFLNCVINKSADCCSSVGLQTAGGSLASSALWILQVRW